MAHGAQDVHVVPVIDRAAAAGSIPRSCPAP